jgi:hypothetical protein
MAQQHGALPVTLGAGTASGESSLISRLCSECAKSLSRYSAGTSINPASGAEAYFALAIQ